MTVAVIGGGFTGLTAAYELAKRGLRVTLFEKEPHLGGLAYGFREPQWDWYLEGGYHHLFTNDRAIFSLIEELGLGDKILRRQPITATYWNGDMYQFDTPGHLLRFPGLSLLDKFRTGSLAAFCKVFPFWQLLEGVTAKDLFQTVGGAESWQQIWEPLMVGKFSTYNDQIAASWLWARIHKRTRDLCSIEGGFHTLVEALVNAIKTYGGTILTGVPLQSIHIKKNCIYVHGRTAIYNSFSRVPFDRLLLTVPTPIAAKLIPRSSFIIPHSALSVPHLHAQTLILETSQPILRDVYWLNVTDRSFPFVAAVGHTNFMDPSHYGGHHITYFGNYLPEGHRYLSMTAEQLLEEFLPFIQRLSVTSNFKIQTSNSRKKSLKFKVLSLNLFVGLFAQPVHQLHYSRVSPKLKTSIPGLFLANLDSIYPWDRGTNYAVELGQKAARFIMA